MNNCKNCIHKRTRGVYTMCKKGLFALDAGGEYTICDAHEVKPKESDRTIEMKKRLNFRKVEED